MTYWVARTFEDQLLLRNLAYISYNEILPNQLASCITVLLEHCIARRKVPTAWQIAYAAAWGVLDVLETLTTVL